MIAIYFLIAALLFMALFAFMVWALANSPEKDNDTEEK
jgi:hypothetical protein